MIPNNITIPLSWLQKISPGDLLGYAALIFVFLAYRKSLRDKYDSWKSLLQSFLDELNEQKSWLGGVYHSNCREKMFYSPNKIVFKLSFESAKDITRRGISDLKAIEPKVRKMIAIFNERIEAFNSLLDYQRSVITADSVLSQQLQEELENLGLQKRSVLFPKFSIDIENLKNNRNTENIYYLAKKLYFINEVIHIQLISDESREGYLHYLWKELSQGINKLLADYERKIPFYLKDCLLGIIIIVSIVLFLIIENLFR